MSNQIKKAIDNRLKGLEWDMKPETLMYSQRKGKMKWRQGLIALAIAIVFLLLVLIVLKRFLV